MVTCDTITVLDVDTIVPGHGPVTDKRGVLDVKRYLEFVFAGDAPAVLVVMRPARCIAQLSDRRFESGGTTRP